VGGEYRGKKAILIERKMLKYALSHETKIFLKKSKKTLDNTLCLWYNTEEKEVEQAVLTLPYETRMG
jgi:hypothetical protein